MCCEAKNVMTNENTTNSHFKLKSLTEQFFLVDEVSCKVSCKSPSRKVIKVGRFETGWCCCPENPFDVSPPIQDITKCKTTFKNCFLPMQDKSQVIKYQVNLYPTDLEQRKVTRRVVA